MRTLVIVDAQKDFCEGGNLGVNGGNEVCKKIAKDLIGKYDRYFVTKDWHPIDHCSFKSQGGMWPTHCVRNTIGASLNDSIENALDTVPYLVLNKGKDKNSEEYGANFPCLLASSTEDEVHICGIAFDYCVKETAKLAIKDNIGKVVVLRDYCAAISKDISETEKELEEKGILVQ